MSLRLKNIIYTLGLLSAMFLVYHYRQNQKTVMMTAKGTTMGSIAYNIKYFDQEQRQFKPQIDSLLIAFNQSLNTYWPSSEISTFNKQNEFTFESHYFYEALSVSKEIYTLTNGAFDPSIGPLINAWGFGPEQGFLPDSSYIDSLQQFLGFNLVIFDEQKVMKEDPRLQLSFSASAKGYGVDVVAEYLASKNITNYFVEIGGEVRAEGIHENGDRIWTVGILHPESKENQLQYYAIVELDNRSMATSGNYFNYHVIDGIKYGHTIDPKSGYPIMDNLLSATVFANTCHEADAIATALMVMGKEKAVAFLEDNDQYDGYLIYSTPDGDYSYYATPNVESTIKLVK